MPINGCACTGVADGTMVGVGVTGVVVTIGVGVQVTVTGPKHPPGTKVSVVHGVGGMVVIDGITVGVLLATEV